MYRTPKILVLSKDKDNLSEFKSLFRKAKIFSRYSNSFLKVLSFLKNSTFNIVILDLDSLYLKPDKIKRFIKKVKGKNPQLIVLLATSPSFLNLALSLFKKGADFYIKKPIGEREAKIIIENFYNFQKLLIRNQELKEKMNNLNKKIESLALVDFLTNCYNYRYLVRRLKEEIKRAQRYLRSISLVSIDIDSLRDINENYGEDIGDLIIVQTANLLRKNIRANDVVCRTSGGEFYTVLPDTSKREAMIFSERIYDKITRYKFEAKAKLISIKIKMGIAIYPSEGIKSPTSFIRACKKAVGVSKGKERPITFYSKKALFKEKTEDVESLKKKLSRLNQLVSESLIEMIYGFAKTIEAKDSYTGRHVEDTAGIAEKIAKRFKLPSSEIEDIRHAAILHDLGKIGIEEKILLKRGKLTHLEMEKIKKHPLIAAQILKSIHALSGAVPAILHHHERFDGKGYPYGLKGEEIPLSARIIAVADVYEALTSDRPYRKAYSKQEALEIIKKESGTHFDPKVVKAFLEIVK